MLRAACSDLEEIMVSLGALRTACCVLRVPIWRKVGGGSGKKGKEGGQREESEVWRKVGPGSGKTRKE